MHPMGRFFRGVWHWLDNLRRFLNLLVLLALVGIVIGALRQGSAPRVPDKAALVVRPSGDIVEQLSGEPLERALTKRRGRASHRRCSGT